MSGYAFAKLLEGADQGKERTVPISEITPSIYGLNYDSSKKYSYQSLKVKIIDCK